MTRVGILAVQGDVPEHRAALRRILPEEAIRLIRTPSDLSDVDALLMPGGESTAIGRVLLDTGLGRAIRTRAGEGLPIFATCAGLILVAKELEVSPTGHDPAILGLLDVKVRRNDYGRQRESFEAPVRVSGLDGGPFPGVFIRAPRILAVEGGATSIAFRDDEIVGVRQGSTWGLCFHPELSGDDRLLRWFLSESEVSVAESSPSPDRSSPKRPKGKRAR